MNQKKLPKVVIMIPTRGQVTMQWALAFRNLIMPPGTQLIYKAGYVIDHDRNELVNTALNLGYDWMFFLDDDVIPPEDVLVRLFKHGHPIVSGMYYQKTEPLRPLLFRESENGAVLISDFKFGNLVPVDYTGAGCLLMHRSVLEKIGAPWFQWTKHRSDLPNKYRFGEDFFFFRRARDCGFQPYVDTAVACLHVGLGQAELGGSFSPLAYPGDDAPGSVDKGHNGNPDSKSFSPDLVGPKATA